MNNFITWKDFWFLARAVTFLFMGKLAFSGEGWIFYVCLGLIFYVYLNEEAKLDKIFRTENVYVNNETSISMVVKSLFLSMAGFFFYFSGIHWILLILYTTLLCINLSNMVNCLGKYRDE